MTTSNNIHTEKFVWARYMIEYNADLIMEITRETDIYGHVRITGVNRLVGNAQTWAIENDARMIPDDAVNRMLDSIP